jgi:hypothetical protein
MPWRLLLGKHSATDTDQEHDRHNPPPRGRTLQGQPEANPESRPPPTLMMPQWRMGDRVRWGGRVGSFVRNLNDGIHAEIRIEPRVYRVRVGDVGPG